MRRPVVLVLYTAVFVGEAMWSAIVPLVPAFVHRLGAVAGPAFAGVLVQHFGLAAPFTVAAAVTVLLGAGLALDRSGSGRSAAPARATPRALAGAMRERRVTASLALMGLGGLLGGAVNLLVPLQLHRNGVSTAAIGAAFAASAVLFIGSSAAVAHLGDRAARAGVGRRRDGGGRGNTRDRAREHADGGGGGVPDRSGPGVGGHLHGHVPARGAGRARGRDRRRHHGGAPEHRLGLSTLVAPIIAGALAQTASDRFAYGLVAVLCLAAAPWIAAARPAPAVRPALGGDEMTTSA